MHGGSRYLKPIKVSIFPFTQDVVEFVSRSLNLQHYRQGRLECYNPRQELNKTTNFNFTHQGSEKQDIAVFYRGLAYRVRIDLPWEGNGLLTDHISLVVINSTLAKRWKRLVKSLKKNWYRAGVRGTVVLLGSDIPSCVHISGHEISEPCLAWWGSNNEFNIDEGDTKGTEEESKEDLWFVSTRYARSTLPPTHVEEESSRLSMKDEGGVREKGKERQCALDYEKEVNERDQLILMSTALGAHLMGTGALLEERRILRCAG